MLVFRPVEMVIMKILQPIIVILVTPPVSTVMQVMTLLNVMIVLQLKESIHHSLKMVHV